MNIAEELLKIARELTAAPRSFSDLSSSEQAVARKMMDKGYTWAVQISTIDGDFGEPLYFKDGMDIVKFVESFPSYKKARMKWQADLMTADEGGHKKYGFDLTEIKAANWIKALRSVGVSTTPKQTGRGWLWKGPGIIVVTANDPIGGDYYREGGRGNEKDYASYIGIEGDPAKVMTLVKAIKRGATDIKDESPGEREFI
jgi:hypothetical protein